MREKRARKRRKLWVVWMMALFIIGGCAGGKALYSSLFITIDAAAGEEGMLPSSSLSSGERQIEPIPAQAAVGKSEDNPAVVHSDADGGKLGETDVGKQSGAEGSKRKDDGKAPESASPTPTTTPTAGKPAENDSAKAGKAGESGNKKESKQIALTFDDGPDKKYTPQILDILKQHNVKATFFLVGRQIKLYPDIVKRIVDEGHSVGNHSWGHQQMDKLDAEAIKQDLSQTDEFFQSILGMTPSLFRAPYGAVSPTLIEEVKASGREMISWSVDTRDWAGDSPEVMMKTIRKQMSPGGIILMHSFGGKKGKLDNTVELLPKLIKELKADGYSIVTVPELENSKLKR